MLEIFGKQYFVDINRITEECRIEVKNEKESSEENLRTFLGHYYGLLVNDRTIRFEPLETMRGFTFNSTLMILDEAQNCTAEQIKMFVTRLGKNSKIIINGDVKQTDLKSRSGLEYIMNRVSGVEGIAICKLTHDDIQRNDVVARFLRAIEE